MEAFSVVIPYFNEAQYIARTLTSLMGQSHAPRQLILVDNASTDGSEEICRSTLRHWRGGEVCYAHEPRPGWINAIQHGTRAVQTPFVSIVDADTVYPPHYLATAARLFREGGEKTVAVMAKDIYTPPNSPSGLWVRWFYAGLAKVLYWQTFAGGYGHSFRTEAFRRAGGYSAEIWPYVLADHELMNRLRKIGRARYHHDMWCVTSLRRTDRSRVSWTTFEQLVYHTAPPFAHDWFFNKFLATRLKNRAMDQSRLRERPWETADAPVERRAA